MNWEKIFDPSRQGWVYFFISENPVHFILNNFAMMNGMGKDFQ